MAERFDIERCGSAESCKECERKCLWHRVVAKAHAADVVEVVHGRWIICSDSYYPYCSECKEEPYRKSNADLPKFCPNCGARMDGE